jgi:hypothetical protein
MLISLLPAMLAGLTPPSVDATQPVLARESLGCLIGWPGDVAEIRAAIANPGGQPRQVRLTVVMAAPGSADVVRILDASVQLGLDPITRVPAAGPRTVVAADPSGPYRFLALLSPDIAQLEPFEGYLLRVNKIDEKARARRARAAFPPVVGERRCKPRCGTRRATT